MKYPIIVVSVLSFLIFTPLYYFLSFSLQKIDVVFITISIFLFSTLIGFFISRQTTRYANIIQKVTDFDGNMSFLYRASSCFGDEAKAQVASILKKHYENIAQSGDWDSYFAHKSTTITDLTNLVVALAESRESLNPAQSGFISRAYFGLGELQKIRKNLIALYKERIPKVQWFLIFALLFVLVLAVSFIPSYMMLLASVIKAAFVSAVFAVVLMLYKLNNLSFFEAHIGQSSAQDVLDIIDGVK